MLVLDIADDFLDQILDRDQPVGAGEFIDHNRQVNPLGAHVGEHIERPARLWHIERLAHQRGPVRRRQGAIGEEGEDILDVDHPDHIIERLAVDRHARMAMFGEGRDHLLPANRRIDRDDLPARHRDVIGIVLGEVEQVAQHLPLGPRQIAARAAAVLGRSQAALALVLVDRFFELFAQRPRPFEPEHLAQGRPQPAATVRLSRQGCRRWRIGHGLRNGS